MRRATLPVLVVLCVVVAAGLAWLTLNRGGGSIGGDLVTENRAVDPFRRLDVNGSADVTLVAGAREGVAVETRAGGQSLVRIRSTGDTLEISSGTTRRWWDSIIGSRGPGSVTPRITVTFRQVEAINLSGTVKLAAARIEATELRIAASGGTSVRIDDLQAQRLRLSGSGALKATLAGRVVDQDVSISGAGEVHADRLESENAKVSVSGAGSIVINARKTLRASISGAGSVEYYGDPEVKQSVSGVGRVRRRESAHVEGVRVAALERNGPPQCSASALNSNGTSVAGSRSAWTPGSTRTSPTRQSASSVVSICTTSAVRSAA
jgi:hypothetical protein